MRKTLTILITAALFTLAACGSDDNDSADFNDADVTFARQMIPHHQQAVQMSRLASSRAASQEVKDLAAAIEAAQKPEITEMADWLESWDEDGGRGGHDMGHMDDMDDMDGMGGMSGMGGMLTGREMAALSEASGETFDRLFLEGMIRHHEGAVEMAQTEQEDGRFRDAVALAKRIEAAQTAEIAQMNILLGN